MDQHFTIVERAAQFLQDNPVSTGRQVGVACHRGAVDGHRAKSIDIDDVGDIISTELRLLRNVKIVKRIVYKGREGTAFVKLNAVGQENVVHFAHPFTDVDFAQAYGRIAGGQAFLKLHRYPMNGSARTVFCPLRNIKRLPGLPGLGQVFDLFGRWLCAAVLCGCGLLENDYKRNQKDCFEKMRHKVFNKSVKKGWPLQRNGR